MVNTTPIADKNSSRVEILTLIQTVSHLLNELNAEGRVAQKIENFYSEIGPRVTNNRICATLLKDGQNCCWVTISIRDGQGHVFFQEGKQFEDCSKAEQVFHENAVPFTAPTVKSIFERAFPQVT